jgi:Ser/Thr protein kinase RdoA (MazF antagonist)
MLYEGDRITGIIDFAAAKADHVAVDLARLLGSLIPGDATRTNTAMQAYAAVRPLPHPELVPMLDRTGVVVAVTNWLRWLYHDGREYPDRNAVAERLAGLVRRIT